MGQQNRAILTTELSQQITACAFSKDDLRILCEILQESSHAAAEEEIANYTPLDRPMEQILADREVLRLGFELTVRKHRYILGCLVIAVFGNFLYDLLKIASTVIF